MKIALSFVAPPEPCGYLPEETWRLRYEMASELTPIEYEQRMESGWRRFGHSMFRPECPACTKCQSLRVDVNQFEMNRSQQRAMKRNRDLQVECGPPSVSESRLQLYDKYHAYQAEMIGWPTKDPELASSYFESFIDNPFVTQEWCYYLGEQLIAVGYVDHLPHTLSAIYFFYDPDHRDRSLGTFNVLSIIKSAREQSLRHVHLGYFVDSCRSLQYKSHFKPHELFEMKSKTWRPAQPD